MTQSLKNLGSLRAYGEIAKMNLSQVALGKKDGQTIVQDASKTDVCGLKRLFNTEASKNLNRAVLADFKNCLKRAFGNRIAEMAIDRYIGADAFYKGTKLSSQKIKNAMRFANGVYQGDLKGLVDKKMLQKSEVSSLRQLRHNFTGRDKISIKSASFSNAEFSFRSLKNLEGNGNAANHIRAFARLNAQVNDLLSEMPTDFASFRELSEEIDKLKDELDTLQIRMSDDRDKDFRTDTDPYKHDKELLKQVKADNGRNTASAIKNEVQLLIDRLEIKRNEAREVANNNPTSYEAVGKAAKMYVEAMKNSCEKLADKPEDLKKACGKSQPKAENFKKSVTLMEKSGLVGQLIARAMGDDENITDIQLDGGRTISAKDIKELMDEVMPPVEQKLKNAAPRTWQLHSCDAEKRLGKDFHERLAKFACGFADLVGKADGHNYKMAKSKFCEKKLPKMIREDYGGVLNKQEWKTIVKPMTFQFGGKHYACTSTITPASQMEGPVGDLYAEKRDENNNVIQPKVNGVMCHGFGEKTHAVNLARSELKVMIPQPDGTMKEETVFKGVRHGVNAATALENEQEFAAANFNRAKETAMAAFTSSDELMAKAQKAIQNAGTNEIPEIEFTMSSVSLLTPDNFRSKVDTCEKRMLKGQTAAFQKLATDGMTIQIGGRDVKIRPKIMTFNFGVNSGAVSWYKGLSGCWSNSDPMNNAGLQQLNNEVNAFLEAHREQNNGLEGDGFEAVGQLDKKGQIVHKLITQINDMHAKHAESAKTGDNYKMAARVAVLTQMLGGVPCWNCKSGKDRTGMMDVECKALATYIALKGDVPELDEISDDQKNMNRTFAMESGNHEIQKLNTGLAGFKLGTGVYKKRIGGDWDQSNFIQGGSHMVKA